MEYKFEFLWYNYMEIQKKKWLANKTMLMDYNKGKDKSESKIQVLTY